VIGNAQIVGLGEGTHGTSEIFQMKARLVSFLAQQMGFTIFAMEANMPEAYLINDYVMTGRGDPRQLLEGMYFWTWNTQEVLDFIQWMRQYNASGQGTIQFLGFDMQYSVVAMDYVTRFVRQADPGLLPTATSAYSLIPPLHLPTTATSSNMAQYQAAQTAAQKILNQLQANRDQYLQTMLASEVDWAIQNANIVLQDV
jgi:erythromycin esterase